MHREKLVNLEIFRIDCELRVVVLGNGKSRKGIGKVEWLGRG